MNRRVVLGTLSVSGTDNPGIKVGPYEKVLHDSQCKKLKE